MIPIMEPFIDEQEIDLVLDCLKSGWISSQGRYILEFEKAFSNYCGAEFGIATSNGTTALHLALATLGVGPGDEVIVPALSFIATANAVVYAGARPVFADVNEKSWTLDPAAVKDLITHRTRAIIPVHLYGHPADMDPILRLAEENGLWVIEDAAEAHGARYKGKRVGSLGHMACFSFYGNKIITTGEGGMIVTSHGEWTEKALMLRGHGMSKDRKYWHPVLGYNYRMTNIQAAIGLGQVNKLDYLIAQKRRVAQAYRQGLEGVRGVILPPEESWAKNVFWLYSIRIAPETGKKRDDLIEHLERHQVESRPLFYPIPEMPFYQGGGRFPITKKISEQGISLPSAASITSEQIGTVVELIKQFLYKD